MKRLLLLYWNIIPDCIAYMSVRVTNVVRDVFPFAWILYLHYIYYFLLWILPNSTNRWYRCNTPQYITPTQLHVLCVLVGICYCLLVTSVSYIIYSYEFHTLSISVNDETTYRASVNQGLDGIFCIHTTTTY